MTDHNPYLVDEHLSGLLGFIKRNFAPESHKALKEKDERLNKQLNKKKLKEQIEHKQRQLHGHRSLIPHM